MEPRSLAEEIWLDVGVEGELLLARVRLLVIVLFLALQFVPGRDPAVRRISVPLIVVALVLAALVYYVASRRPRTWLAFASSIADVTLVSCALGAFLVVGLPQVAVNADAGFQTYLLAIAFAALRYDWRVCAVAGGLAVVQYGAVVLYAIARWDLSDPRFAPLRYGVFDWSSQAVRLLILALATVVCALVVHRAQRLRRVSDIDRLTGLANRNGYEARLAEETSRAGRYSRPLTVALVELDQFEHLRTREGESAAESAVQAVAAVLRRSVRRSDLAGYLESGRFVLLLPETTAEMVLSKLEDVRFRVAQARIRVGSFLQRTVSATVSIGVANWPDDGPSMDAVVGAASARLAEAARQGRNQVVGPPPTVAAPRRLTEPAS